MKGIVFLFSVLIVFNLVIVSAFAADKVVVIPLNSTKDNTGVEYAGGDQHLLLSSTDVVVRSGTVTTTGAGYIIINASGYWDYTGTGTTAVPRCSITTGTQIDFSALTLAEVSQNVHYVPFATNRTYSVPGSGSYTYNLVCDMSFGTAFVDDTYMSMIFVQNHY